MCVINTMKSDFRGVGASATIMCGFCIFDIPFGYDVCCGRFSWIRCYLSSMSVIDRSMEGSFSVDLLSSVLFAVFEISFLTN